MTPTAEIMPVYVPPKYESVVHRTTGYRPDTSFEQLASRSRSSIASTGSVTAGILLRLTDGAACVLHTSEEKARALGYEPLGYIKVDHRCAGSR